MFRQPQHNYWHTRFIFDNDIAYSNPLYDAKIELLGLSTDTILEEGIHDSFLTAYRTIINSDSDDAKTILRQMIAIAINCADRNGFYERSNWIRTNTQTHTQQVCSNP